MLKVESVFEGIYLIEATKVVRVDELLDLFPGKRVVMCDAYVDGMEKVGKPIAGGFEVDRLINIDHHAPVQSMERIVSSTPLAIDYLQAHGPLSTEDVVVINHVDADSMLSSGTMRGLLEADERFAKAAMAADHTGEENDLADLLQPCGKRRDLAFSWRNLRLRLAGQEVEAEALALLARHQQQRQRARQLVEEGLFTITKSGLAWVYLPEKIDGVFFPALLPEAKLILQFSPLPEDEGRLLVGHRLGLAASEGMTLHNLGASEIDPAYGGRWNAGNNSRAGGTGLAMEEYVRLFEERLGEWGEG